MAANRPDAPSNLRNNEAVTGEGQIGLQWDEGAYDGGDPIQDYRISYDQSTDTWIELVSGVTQTSYTVTGLTTGSRYKFKVEARNNYGFSTATSEVVIYAATLPSKPNTPSTYRSGNNIVVSWEKPYEGGSPLLQYRIEVQTSDPSVYSVELDNCNGANVLII